MSTTCQKNIFFSEKSIVYPSLIEAKTEFAGKVNRVNLPSITLDKIKNTIGEKITNGDNGTIYKVNGSSSDRVYKVIPLDQFANGNEIIISKIASDIAVAPTFYSAFLANQISKKYVVI